MRKGGGHKKKKRHYKLVQNKSFPGQRFRPSLKTRGDLYSCESPMLYNTKPVRGLQYKQVSIYDTHSRVNIRE